MIAVSCPGDAGVSQVAYLLKSFALCEGTPMEDAVEIQRLCAAVNGARTYDEYARCAKEMAKYEVLRKMGGGSGIKSKERWDPSGPEFFFDPMKNIAQTKIPVLAFFGENDKQADPIQGLTAYTRALKDGGNQH